MKWHILVVLVLFLLFGAAEALEIRSGDDIKITVPVDDDIIATGGRVSINAPVRSVLAAAGEVFIDAPVSGDVIAAGGICTINGDVDGKIIAAGGRVVVNGNISTNAIIAGGEVEIGERAGITRDVFISAGTVTNRGMIGGTLSVTADEFVNTGSAGTVTYQKPDRSTEDGISLLSIFVSIGFLILGILLIHFFPAQFFAVDEEIRRDPVKNVLIGAAVLIFGFIILVLLTISLIGLPIAFMLAMVLVAAILAASLFVSQSVGTVIKTRFSLEISAVIAFIIGFILLHILMAIPIGGFFIRIIVVALGTGALFTALQAQRVALFGKKEAVAPDA